MYAHQSTCAQFCRFTTEEYLPDWDIYRSAQLTGRDSNIVNGDVEVYTEDLI